MWTHCKVQSITSFKKLKNHILIETDVYDGEDDVQEVKLSDIPESIQADDKE